MKFSQFLCGLVTVFCSVNSIAQSQAVPAQSDSAGSYSRDFRVIAGQSIWFVSWDARLFDARLVIPNPANPQPVIETSSPSAVVSKAVPITTLGIATGPWVLSTSIIPRSNFSTDDASTGSVSRSEYDINFGYGFGNGLSAALIYKYGKILNLNTVSAVSLLGGGIENQELKALLLGLSANAELVSNLRVYGNAAFGPGKVKSASLLLGDGDNDFNYSIGEVGLIYRFPTTSFGSVSLRAGYRVQVVEIKDVAEARFTTGPSVNVSSIGANKLQSTSQGVLLGLSVDF